MNDFIDIELDSIDSLNENDCPICYEKLENFVKLKCNHNFCLKCYSEFIKNKINKCSICREEIKEIDRSITIFNEYVETNNLLLTTNRYNINSYKILKIKYQLLLFILYICFFIYFFHMQKYHTKEKNNDINKKEHENFLRISYFND